MNVRGAVATALVLLAAWGIALPVAAHKPDQSYIFVRVEDRHMTGRIEIAVGDLNRIAGLALPSDALSDARLARHAAQIRDYLRQRVAFAPNGVPQPPAFGDLAITGSSIGAYVVVPFRMAQTGQDIDYVDIDYRVGFDVISGHRGLLVIEDNWKAGKFGENANVALAFGPDATRQRLDLSRLSVWTGVAAMVALGIHHIAIGLDHILFLIALLLPAVVRRENGRWVPVERFGVALWHVVAVVTVFTVAHTITLSLAVTGMVNLPSRLVESVIALSIAIAAAELLVPILGRRLWVVVFVFGLFHGFGFASVLAEMGIPRDYLVHSLLGFNVGVELGQVAIVCTVFPLLYALRATTLYHRGALQYGAVILIFIGAYWFTERAFELDLPLGEIIQRPFAALR